MSDRYAATSSGDLTTCSFEESVSIFSFQSFVFLCYVTDGQLCRLRFVCCLLVRQVQIDCQQQTQDLVARIAAHVYGMPADDVISVLVNYRCECGNSVS